MQTVTLRIKDDYAEKFMTLLDVLPKGKVSVVDEMDSYKKSKRFLRDKEIMQKRLDDVLSGRAVLSDYDDGMDEIDKMIDEIEYENSKNR